MDPDLWDGEEEEDEIVAARNPVAAYELGLTNAIDAVRGCYKTLFCGMCSCAMPCDCGELEEEDRAALACYDSHNKAIDDVIASLEQSLKGRS